jgi:hypothetical protein
MEIHLLCLRTFVLSTGSLFIHGVHSIIERKIITTETWKFLLTLWFFTEKKLAVITE